MKDKRMSARRMDWKMKVDALKFIPGGEVGALFILALPSV
jgi:hypothetical protein